MPELSIRKIIEKTLSGEIRIPSFQRGFVWEPEKVAFFIDSLYKGYPIGSLLFWRTNIRLENERQLGNYSLPEPTKGYPYETGGILIGRYSDDLKWAEITTITGAPAESKQTLCSFVRSTRGIITKLKRAWQKQQYYLGEWHYHPNASPKPSALDLKTMVNLSKDEDLGCPEPILLVIGGSSSNWLQYIGVYVKEQEIELYEINNN